MFRRIAPVLAGSLIIVGCADVFTTTADDASVAEPSPAQPEVVQPIGTPGASVAAAAMAANMETPGPSALTPGGDPDGESDGTSNPSPEGAEGSAPNDGAQLAGTAGMGGLAANAGSSAANANPSPLGNGSSTKPYLPVPGAVDTPGLTPDTSACDDGNPCTDDSEANGICRHLANTAVFDDSCYTGPAGTAGVGACIAGKELCVDGQPSGICEGEVHPSEEICDGLDNNCNGEVDEGLGVKHTFFQDKDADGFGDPKNPLEACAPPPGYVGNADDCWDDTTTDVVNPDGYTGATAKAEDIHPGAHE
ncbi:MAG: hypothetical protein ACI9WU_000127, partial [Myxococcota bacterium]